MPLYQLKTKQLIPAKLETVWEFIATPRNLKRITPDYMGFDITTPDIPERMYPGMIIGYTVKPILGIPTDWVTEITQVEEQSYFVDEQRLGPYTMWHHEHHVEEHPKGTLMRDTISYIPPLGPIGALANQLIIKRQLQEIFDYRQKALEEIFGMV